MSPIRMSRVESAIRVVLAFNESFNRHDVAGMLKLMSDDCIFESTAPGPDGAVYPHAVGAVGVLHPPRAVHAGDVATVGRQSALLERPGGRARCSGASTATGARTGLGYGCPRSEGRVCVNRVRTVKVAALSDVVRRFGVPGALFNPSFP